jgi:hypothetical protein
MKVGVHLPLMEFRGEGPSRQRLMDAVDAARDCGLAAVSANDHFVFTTPWLDGPTALAAVIERSGYARAGCERGCRRCPCGRSRCDR